MNLTSEDAVNSLVSDEIEGESLTEATASASTIVVAVDSEMAVTKEPDEGEEPCDEPGEAPESPESEPEPDEPDSDDQE
jgi:hypothetical protein